MASLSRNSIFLAQGAEARVSTGIFLGRTCVIKERFSKSYRHKSLDDQLRKSRTVREARCWTRCLSAGVLCPTVYFVHFATKSIFMEFLKGITVTEFFCKNDDPASLPLRRRTATLIGQSLAQIHDAGVVHGDPTTSNMLLTEIPGESNDGKLAMIDFGLGFQNASDDDKAVDLYVLERAMLSTHPNTEALFVLILETYETFSPKTAKNIVKKMEAVRARGRKRMAFG